MTWMKSLFSRSMFGYRIDIPEHAAVGFFADFRCASSVAWRRDDFEVAMLVLAPYQLNYLALGALLHDFGRDVADCDPNPGVVGLVGLGTVGNADVVQRHLTRH